jgi:hypothetical protein
MHVSKDSMWREIWKILQKFLETKQDLNKTTMNLKFVRQPSRDFAESQADSAQYNVT